MKLLPIFLIILLITIISSSISCSSSVSAQSLSFDSNDNTTIAASNGGSGFSLTNCLGDPTNTSNWFCPESTSGKAMIIKGTLLPFAITRSTSSTTGETQSATYDENRDLIITWSAQKLYLFHASDLSTYATTPSITLTSANTAPYQFAWTNNKNFLLFSDGASNIIRVDMSSSPSPSVSYFNYGTADGNLMHVSSDSNSLIYVLTSSNKILQINANSLSFSARATLPGDAASDSLSALYHNQLLYVNVGTSERLFIGTNNYISVLAVSSGSGSISPVPSTSPLTVNGAFASFSLSHDNFIIATSYTNNALLLVDPSTNTKVNDFVSGCKLCWSSIPIETSKKIHAFSFTTEDFTTFSYSQKPTTTLTSTTTSTTVAPLTSSTTTAGVITSSSPPPPPPPTTTTAITTIDDGDKKNENDRALNQGSGTNTTAIVTSTVLIGIAILLALIGYYIYKKSEEKKRQQQEQEGDDENNKKKGEDHGINHKNNNRSNTPSQERSVSPPIRENSQGIDADVINVKHLESVERAAPSSSSQRQRQHQLFEGECEGKENDDDDEPEGPNSQQRNQQQEAMNILMMNEEADAFSDAEGDDDDDESIMSSTLHSNNNHHHHRLAQKNPLLASSVQVGSVDDE